MSRIEIMVKLEYHPHDITYAGARCPPMLAAAAIVLELATSPVVDGQPR